MRVNTTLDAIGIGVRGIAVNAEGMGKLQFSQPLTVRQAHAPLVSLDRSVVDPRLMRALALFELKRASRIPADPAVDRMVLPDNLDLLAIPRPRKATLQKFVKGGGVVLAIDGQPEGLATSKRLSRHVQADAASHTGRICKNTRVVFRARSSEILFDGPQENGTG